MTFGNMFQEMRLFFVCLLTVTLVALSPGSSEAYGEGSVFERRRELLTIFDQEGGAAIPKFLDALEDERVAVSRTAAHLLVRLGEPAQSTFDAVLKHPDFQVRRIVFDALSERSLLSDYLDFMVTDEHPSIRRDFFSYYLPNFFLSDGKPPEELMAVFSAVYADADASVRRDIVDALAALPMTESSFELLQTACEDESPGIREVAVRAVLGPRLEKVERLSKERKFQELVDAFGDEDFTSWPDDMASQGIERRAYAYRHIGRYEQAERDLERAVLYNPDRLVLTNLARLYRDHLDEPERAIRTFRKAVIEGTGRGGHRYYSPMIEGAAMLRDKGRYDEAMQLLRTIEESRDLDDWAGYWAVQFLEAYARTFAARGKIEEAVMRYEQALSVAGIRDNQKSRIQDALESIQ